MDRLFDKFNRIDLASLECNNLSIIKKKSKMFPRQFLLTAFALLAISSQAIKLEEV